MKNMNLLHKFVVLVFLFIGNIVSAQKITENGMPPPGGGDPQCKIIGFSYLNTNTNSIEINWNVSSLNIGIRSENNCRLFDFDLGYKNVHEKPTWITSVNFVGGNMRVSLQENNSAIDRVHSIEVSNASDSDASNRRSIRITQKANTSYKLCYVDTDGDGFGDHNATPISRIQKQTNESYNNLDNCIDEYSSTNNGCLEPYENRNWTRFKSYDITGKLIGSGKNYYDDLGKLEQSQSLDIKENKIYANQTLYDTQGRPALQSLAAPITSGESYMFKEGLVKKANGTVITTSDLDENGTLDPTIASSSELGLYYNNNSQEPLMDKTDRPYARSVYSTLNPGAVKQAVGGNKQNGAWRRGYSFSMAATQEMYYVYGYNSFPRNPSVASTYSNISAVLNDSNKHIVWLKAGKTVVQDVTGSNESVVFTDADGKTLGAARAGGNQKYDALSLIGEQNFVDVHIPIGCDGTASLLGNTSDYKIYDLKTELPNGDISKAGFYRIEYTGSKVLTKSHALTYIDKASNTNAIQPVMADAVGIRYKVNYYDYSLNYYNTVGQLTSSLQPLGFDNSCLTSLKPTVTHNENLKSFYSYNTLGQLMHTKSPDEGEAWFKYRKDGQIRFSQNSKQKDPNQDGNFNDAEFSYTNYDELGRPVESGVFQETSTIKFTNSDALLNNVLKDIEIDDDGLPNAQCTEQHFTEYDYLSGASQNRLNSLVSSNYRAPSFLSGNVVRTHNRAINGTIISETYYSYDVYGRVKWMVQNLKDLGVKTIDYEYDPITSQVNKVYFQKGLSAEQFIHKYTYDAATQQLIKVETSTDDNSYITHAEYSYYRTNGALKRTTLAGGIQDIDYVYNLAGQLKAINHPSLQQDPAINPNGTDLFGVTLDYYNGDYQRNTTSFTSQNKVQDVANQYTGNIKAMTWNTKVRASASTTPVLYKYKYNDRNFLQEAIFDGMGNQQSSAPTNLVLGDKVYGTMHAEATNSISLKPGFEIKATSSVEFTAKIVTTNANGHYKTGDYNVSNLTYDANGNILSLDRNKNTENARNEMDKLSYIYKVDKPNQLLRVEDAVKSPTSANDIKGQTGNNYIYNAIGQLTDNVGEHIKYEYNASGLVTKVFYNNTLRAQFYYNDKGFRTKKLSYKSNGSIEKTSDYVLDASGSALAIYENKTQVEVPIYGASRLGMYNKASGTSVYQLTDHLGNVRAVIAKNGNQAVAATSSTDYYPGGMPMPNRQIINGEPYRYGYQGEYAETDPETGKPAFQLRLYDPRINRWLTVDPYGQYDSPYMSMGNSWMNRVDPDGGCDQPDSSCGWFKRLFYSSTQIGAWDAWQSMGTSGSQEMLNSVTITGTSRATLKERAVDIAEEMLWVQTINETPGLQIRYHKNRFVALGHMLGMASPSAKLSTFSRLANKVVKVKSTTPQVGKTVEHILSEGRVLFPKGRLQSGVYDFVITKGNKVILGNGHYHLSNAASKLKAAGRITLDRQGLIKAIDNWSGHYLPNWYQLKNAKTYLEKFGYNTGGARLTDISNTF